MQDTALDGFLVQMSCGGYFFVFTEVVEMEEFVGRVPLQRTRIHIQWKDSIA